MKLFHTSVSHSSDIAKADQETGIFQKDISENQKISIKYLDHIIHSLKIAGLIINIKGKKKWLPFNTGCPGDYNARYSQRI